MINQININIEKNHVIHKHDSQNEKKIINKNFIVKLNSNVFGGNVKLCETEKMNKENSRIFLGKNLKKKSILTFSYKFVKEQLTTMFHLKHCCYETNPIIYFVLTLNRLFHFRLQNSLLKHS